jgi:rhodanese-related sulfurtransferase
MGLFSGLLGSPVPSLDAGQAQAKLRQKPAPFLLDVREPDEYRSGHIEGARLIPLGELGRRLGELPRDSEIICVCHSGSRSSSATRLLSGKGYHAINLRGGMSAWAGAGLPVKKGAAK